MDFRDILKSFDNLSEATTTSDKGTVHKAEPGGYGQKHGTEDVKDQYGKPIGRANLAKMDDKPAVKRGKGRPPKNADASGEVKSYDSSALSKAMGMGKAPKTTGKPSVKHSLKEYFDQLDQALNEAGLAVQPLPGQTKQAFMIKDPANPQAAAITTSDPAVVNAAKSGTLQMQRPGSTPTTANAAKPTTGAGSQVTPMEEDGEKWIQGAIKHPGAFTAKAKSHGMTPAQFRAKVLAHKEDYPAKTEKQAQLAKTLSKLKEVQAPEHFAQSSPMSTGGRNPNAFEGKKGVNPFAKKDDKDEKKGAAPKKGVNPFAKKTAKGAKPDFLDIDKDGDKKEPMKKAAKEKTKVKEGMDSKLQAARLRGKSHSLAKEAYNCHYDDMEEARMYHEGFKEGLDECYGQMPIMGRTAVGEVSPEVGTMASYGAHDMDEGNAFTAGLAKTPHGGKFKVGGSTFTDRTKYDAPLDEFAFESFDSQLKALLESEEKVSEGMTVSISKGQQGSPDSVSVTAQDGEADQLLSIIKTAGLGLFGGEDKGYGASQGTAGAHGGINVVDDHDGMMSLMKKLSGGGETSSSDFADEEGQPEQGDEGHSEEGHSHEGEEDSCNECGMAYESCGCDHGDEQQQVVDEVESEDQMAYNVAEEGAQNPPDSGAAETAADDASEAGEDAALATADAGQDAEEGEENSSVSEDSEDSAEDDEGDDEETVEEGIYESYANSADDTFEADIGFMMNVISGGLNKQKSTGQTTIPVIAGQKNRMGADGLGNPMKESSDLLKDYRKLSGL